MCMRCLDYFGIVIDLRCDLKYTYILCKKNNNVVER